MTSTTTSAKASPGGKASALKTPITKKQILILCSIAAGIAVIVGLYFLWQKTRPRMPRLDAPTPVLAKYVVSEEFEKQPFDMQAQFMKVLDTRNKRDKNDPNKGKELDKAYADGRVTETEYRAALQMAWFGKHLARVDRYAAQGGSQKQTYLDELILEQIKEKELERTNPKPPKENDISGNPSGAEEKARLDKWPAEVREKWYQFQSDYKARKKKIEEARAKTRPAAVR
jgi:hypothetical protein